MKWVLLGLLLLLTVAASYPYIHLQPGDVQPFTCNGAAWVDWKHPGSGRIVCEAATATATGDPTPAPTPAPKPTLRSGW